MLLATVPSSRYSGDCLGYSLPSTSDNRPFALHRFCERAVRTVISENAANEAACSNWRRNLCSGQLLYFECSLRCMQCDADMFWDHDTQKEQRHVKEQPETCKFP